MLVNESEQLFGEMIHLLVIHWLRRAITQLGGMDGETTFGLGLDVEFKSACLVLYWNVETWERLGQRRRKFFSDLALQFFSSGRLERGYGRIGGTGDESTAGLRLDPVAELLDQVLQFHDPEIVASPIKCVPITSVYLPCTKDVALPGSCIRDRCPPFAQVPGPSISHRFILDHHSARLFPAYV